MRIIRKRPTAELISCLNDEREFRFVEVPTVQGAFSWAGVSLHNDCYTNVFVKPNDQSQTCLSFGMAKPDERSMAEWSLLRLCHARRKKTESKRRMKSNGKYGQFHCKNGKENGGDGCNQDKSLIFAEKSGDTMDLENDVANVERQRTIRKAGLSELTAIMQVIEAARGIMRASGNMRQWNHGYPSEEVITADIEKASYPGSRHIFRDIMAFCLSRDGNIRISTFQESTVMQQLVEKHGFSYCGMIHVSTGHGALAYQQSCDKHTDAYAFL